MKTDLKRFFSKKMFITLLFGLSSGLPLSLVFGTLTLWLKDYNIAYKTIGAFSLIRLPYSFKWLWAPVVEQVKLPLLYQLGKRRSWALFSQIWLFIALFVISQLRPDENLGVMAIVALLISFASATQDLVLDAFRVELFDEDEKHAIDGATMYVLGYRLGYLISGAGAIGLAMFMSWNEVYLLVALFLLLGMGAVLCAKEPEKDFVLDKDEKKNVLERALIEPFRLFIKKPYWFVALAIVFFYRFSDAYFGQQAYPFYSALGFSKIEIAYASKLYGMGATILGGILGGYILSKTGLLKGLCLLAVVQGLTTALYIPLYYAGHNMYALLFTIAFENLSSGMATTAIIAFMSVLCNKGYTATQYALLSSLQGLARDAVGSTSGLVVEATSWPIFFLICALMTIPGFILCCYLYKKRPEYVLNS